MEVVQWMGNVRFDLFRMSHSGIWQSLPQVSVVALVLGTLGRCSFWLR